MILCPICSKNSLSFSIGKIIAPDGSGALGVIGIYCRNLGTGMLSSCRFVSGEPMFTHLTSLYLANVEFERQYQDVREKFDLESQILMAKINNIIFAMKEDSLARAQKHDETDIYEFKPLGDHAGRDDTDKDKPP
jgi:hypothetical protein